jgi:hypothetical protein
MKLCLLLSIPLVLFAGCASTGENRAGVAPLDTARIAADLRYLASDLLAGREATTPSEILASDYIASELKKAGVQPYDPQGSYFEPYSIIAYQHDTTSALEIVSGARAKTQKKFTFGKDFFVGEDPDRAIDTTTEIVFGGYGITAPEYHYDDYANIDVRGKMVLILAGEPKSDSANYFDGKALSKYASFGQKYAAAKSHGAKALMTVSLSLRRQGWKAGRGIFGGEDMVLAEPDRPAKAPNDAAPFTAVVISDSTMRELLRGEGHTYDELIRADTTGQPLPTFALHSSVRLAVKPRIATEKSSRNIVGVVEGNDPALRNEFIAVGAHYDHVGTIRGEIYHGADDDGSGTVGVLEVARALARTHANKRSVLVVFHAAEEKGLFGSEYLTSHLTGRECIDLQVNLDMIGREHRDSIFSIGSERLSSELRALIERVNDDGVRMHLNYAYDDPDDPNRYYFRSDHFNYAKHGIPIVFFFDDMRPDYHRPTDTVDKIDFEKIRKVATLTLGIIEQAANLKHKLLVDRND